jgi:hypothetical protein
MHSLLLLKNSIYYQLFIHVHSWTWLNASQMDQLVLNFELDQVFN